MLTDNGMAQVLTFSQQVEKAASTGRELDRMLTALRREAVALAVGPMEDASSTVLEAEILLADVLGKLKELEVAVGSLLNAQALPKRVSELGWTFDGWVPDAGWTAWRTWEPGGAPERHADRKPAGLVYRLELRNTEESQRTEAARHG